MWDIENFIYRGAKGIKKLRFVLDKFGKDCIILVELSYKILSKVEIIDAMSEANCQVSHIKNTWQRVIVVSRGPYKYGWDYYG
ncbi:MAG: hypothetical protein ACFE9C_17625 [Candidatus Hodarchaeota archaeon]